MGTIVREKKSCFKNNMSVILRKLSNRKSPLVNTGFQYGNPELFCIFFEVQIVRNIICRSEIFKNDVFF